MIDIIYVYKLLYMITLYYILYSRYIHFFILKMAHGGPWKTQCEAPGQKKTPRMVEASGTVIVT